MGIDPDKFWNYTYKEVLLIGERYNFNQNLEWERTRYLASVMLQTVAGKKKVKPTMLFKLPQDEANKKPVKPSTRSQFDKMMSRINEIEKGQK